MSTDRAACPVPSECLSCDAPAVVDGFCVQCAGWELLVLTEDERQQSRDLIAGFFPDEDGMAQYAPADALWMALYRAGFALVRRPTVTTSVNTDGPS